MEIRTFTGFWNQEKKLYSINDIALPFAIPLRTLGVLLLSGIPWWILLGAILHVPITNGIILILYVGPPALLGWLGSRPILEGKTLLQYVKSHLAYWLTESKDWKGLTPNRDGTEQDYETSYRLYHRDLKKVTR
jgi:hypothetical protein